VPYGYGFIRLDGADTLLQHYIDIEDESKVKIGARVEPVFADERKGTIKDIAVLSNRRLMLNPYRRTICLEGRLGACLVTGTEKIRCGYGNGDCLLLDFRHRLFAVADASERFPQASHLLVERWLEAVLESGPPETSRNSTPCSSGSGPGNRTSTKAP
jgi:hypothetical protein